MIYFLFLKSWLRYPFYNEWQGTEIDPRICKISENIFYLANLKVLIKLPTKPKSEGPPTQGHVVILSSKKWISKTNRNKKVRDRLIKINFAYHH